MNVYIANVQNNVLQKKEHYLTSDYKLRNSNRNHNGIDLIGKNKSIDNVISIADGKVITSKYSKTAGNYVEIEHANGYITRYLHMQDNSVKVKKGDIVKKGDVLGRMGNTGDSRGAHLHFAVLSDKRTVVDPLPYLLGKKDFTVNNDNFIVFVKKVQEALGVKVDGIVGIDTLNNTVTISSTTNKRHPVVKVLQEYFLSLGYSEIGKIDGIVGQKFINVVKQYQKDNNLYVDGIITKKNKTWQKLLRLN